MAGFFIAASGIGLATLVATPVSLLTFFGFDSYKWPILLINTTVSALLAYRKAMETIKPTDNEAFVKRATLVIAFGSYPIALVWLYCFYSISAYGAAFIGLTTKS
jgi:hypothetical protein